MSDDRATLSVKPVKRISRKEQARLDWENLGGREDFLRTLFTILSTAGMFSSDYHLDGRTHAFLAGRRSLGLDILRTTEDYLGPDALMLILEAEKKTQQGGSSGRRSNYSDERNDELGGDDIVDRAGHGLQYLDYGDGDGEA